MNVGKVNADRTQGAEVSANNRVPRGNGNGNGLPSFQPHAGAGSLNSILVWMMPLIQQLLQQLQSPTNPTQVNASLPLSASQQTAIRRRFDDTSPLAYDGLATEFTGKAIDKDGNGKLGVGDVVELRKYGGRAQTNYIEQHVLTAEDMAAMRG